MNEAAQYVFSHIDTGAGFLILFFIGKYFISEQKKADAILAENIAAIGKSFSQDFKKLTDSVIELNLKMAAVVEKVGSHEKRIDRLERKRG